MWLWLTLLLLALGLGLLLTWLLRAAPDRIGIAGGTLALLAGIAALLIVGAQRRAAHYAEYLDDCLRHRPRHECILLWRAADVRDRSKDDPAVVPRLVPMPR